MIQLYDFQQKIADEARAVFRKYRSVLIYLPPRGGKTVIAAYITKCAVEKGNSVWFICHRQELLYQTAMTFQKFDIDFSFIASGWEYLPGKQVYICSIDTLKNRIDKVQHPGLCIWDECFPSGTLIDGVKIEEIGIGDRVRSFNHETNKVEYKKVVHTFRSEPKKIVRVRFYNGDSIICTGGHPFFSNGRYITASNLKRGDYVYTLQRMQKGNKKLNKLSETKGQKERKHILQQRLQQKLHEKNFLKDNGRNKQEVRIESHENEESYVRFKNEAKNVLHPKKNGSQTKDTRREWARAYEATTDIDGKVIILQTDIRIHSKHRVKMDRIPYSLQNRHRTRKRKNSDRSGRLKPQFSGGSRKRQEKTSILRKLRVEGVEVQKQTSDGTFGGMCPDGYVYNIEVSDNNNYFADGFLVHNCHHQSSKGWTIVKNSIDAYHLGLSGTPCRLDGIGLIQNYAYMVLGPQPKWMIENGFMSDYVLYSINPPDMSHSKMIGGDWSAKDKNAAMSKPTITGDVISHYKKLANGKRTILFAPSIEKSQEYAAAFRDNGIMALHMDGGTDKTSRKLASQAFASGEIDILCNVNLFGEGYDLSAQAGRDCTVEAVIDASPTASLSRYLQRVMRALTAKKEKAIILDHAGNWINHGLPDEEIEWTLEGQKRKPRTQEEAEEYYRQCPKCYRVHKANPKCIYCGHIYAIKPRKVVEETEGNLTEIDIQTAKRLRKREQGNARTLPELIALGEQRGYKNPAKWAGYIYTARMRKRSAG